MEVGRVGACVPDCVAPRGRIHRRNAQTCFGVSMHRLCMETPLRGRSGGHTGTAPTISPMVRVIRLPESYLPLRKYEVIVVARCSPLHKHDGIVAARGSPPIIRAVYRRKTARHR